MDTSSDERLRLLLQHFAAAEAVWYASVRPDGRVHLAPVWAVWFEDAAWVLTRRAAVRARNLVANPSVSLSLADPINVLIIEGRAEVAPRLPDSVRAAFQVKYNWDVLSDEEYQLIIRVVPSKLMAWGNHGEGRWAYDGAGWRTLPG